MVSRSGSDLSADTMYKCVDDIRKEFVQSYTFSYKPGEVATRMVEMGIKTTRVADVRNELLAISLIKNGKKDFLFERKKNGVLRGLTGNWDTFYGTYLLKLSNLEKRPYGEPLAR